jgi:hypothetical protein
MAAFIFDFSVLIKRYVQEIGTAWVRRQTRYSPSTLIYVARVTAVEVTCPIARRHKGRPITAAKASSILHRFGQDPHGRHILGDATLPTRLDGQQGKRITFTLEATHFRLVSTSSRTVASVASTSRRATTQPADPAPTIT